MARKRRAPNVVSLVLTILFGIVAAVIAYATWKGGAFELRSQAALPERIIRQWNFNGKTTEGWILGGFSNTRVANGVLRAVYGNPKQSAALQNTNVGVSLPYGPKYIRMRMGINSGGAQNQVNVAISYALQGKNTVTGLQPFSVIPDNTRREYSVTLPDISAATIKSIMISFTGLKSGNQLEVDWVRLVSKWIQPSPSPTITCKTGVNSFSVDTACDGGYRYMTFSCYDGFGRREGGPTSCKSSSVWSSYAQQYCIGHSNCPTPSGGATVIPTPFSTPTCGPVVCEEPPPNCSYQGGTNCSCGILVCTVQATTPTPTPSFKPL